MSKKPHITADCPRCGIKNMTFDVHDSNDVTIRKNYDSMEEFEENHPIEEIGDMYELFAICRNCKKTTILIIAEDFDWDSLDIIESEPPMTIKGSLNNHFVLLGFVKIRDNTTHPPPEFVPENIEKTFREGAACLSIECWNAAGGMFRKCLDLTAKDKLEKKYHGKKLSVKVKCLLVKKILSEDLEKFATYIMLDGNDGLHNRMLTKDDAEDLLGFTAILLGRIYTEPERMRQIEERVKHLEKRRERRKAQ